MSTKWEYKVVFVEGWERVSVEGQETRPEEGERNSAFGRRVLNNLGADGWELAGVQSHFAVLPGDQYGVVRRFDVLLFWALWRRWHEVVVVAGELELEVGVGVAAGSLPSEAQPPIAIATAVTVARSAKCRAFVMAESWTPIPRPSREGRIRRPDGGPTGSSHSYRTSHPGP